MRGTRDSRRRRLAEAQPGFRRGLVAAGVALGAALALGLAWLRRDVEAPSQPPLIEPMAVEGRPPRETIVAQASSADSRAFDEGGRARRVMALREGLRAAQAERDHERRRARVAVVVGEWIRSGDGALLPEVAGEARALVNDAIAVLTRLDPERARSEMALAWGGAIATDAFEAHYFNWPALAAERLRGRYETLEPGTERDVAALGVAVPWAQEDPTMAMAWYRRWEWRLSAPAVADEVLRRILTGAMERSPADALTALATVAEDDTGKKVWRVVAEAALRREVARGGSAVEAVAWANRWVRDGDTWEIMVSAVADEAARSESVAARELARRVGR